MTSFFSDPLEGDHFEGDISGVKLTIQEAEESPLEEDSDDEGESVIIKNAVKNTYRLWPDNEIPYVISNSFGSQERSVIRTAMEQFTRQGLTNIKLKFFFNFDNRKILKAYFEKHQITEFFSNKQDIEQLQLDGSGQISIFFKFSKCQMF